MKKNYWFHKNVFITGGTGLLGSWITKYLYDVGANVTVLIRDHVPKSNLFLNSSFPQVNIVKGDIVDFFLIERVLSEYEIDTIIHLAAQTIAPIANRNPLSTFETNIKGTWVVLEACRRSPLVKKILVASSDKAYGECDKLPYTEDTALRGQHPYDVSKSCSDLIAQSYYKTYKLPICITRCGNIFGGGDLNFNRLFPGVIRSVLFNKPPVLRSDGKFIRDFLYVEDAMEAILLVVKNMDNKSILGQSFNFSNENPVRIIDIVKKIMKKMNSNFSIVIENNSNNEILKQFLSSKKARTILGWKPLFGLDNGIDKTISWYKDFFENKSQETKNSYY